jgi:hypothetical protein
MTIAALGLALALIQTFGLNTIRVFADCAPDSEEGYWPISQWLTDEPTYCASDADQSSSGSYSSNACFSFWQQYYLDVGYQVWDKCQWKSEQYAVFIATSSLVDVEDSTGNNGGIPFSVDSVQNGSSFDEWYHQRHESRKHAQNRTDRGYWDASSYVYDTTYDTWASGRTNNNSSEEALWDPVADGFVHTTSSGNRGGIPAGTWDAIAWDFGH